MTKVADFDYPAHFNPSIIGYELDAWTKLSESGLCGSDLSAL